MRRHFTAVGSSLLLLLAIAEIARPETWVFPHLLESSGNIQSPGAAWDTVLEAFYASGIGPVSAGPGATIDLYLFDNGGALLQSATLNDVCAPCPFALGTGNLKEEIVLDDLILSAGGGNFPVGLSSAWAMLVVSGDPTAVVVEGTSLNNVAGPGDVRSHQLPMPILYKGSGSSSPSSWVIPHAVDSAGSILDTQYAYDSQIHFVYAAGRAGSPPGSGATVDVYLFDQDTEDLLRDDAAGAICAPCAFAVDDVTPKLTVDIETLIRDANSGNYTAASFHKLSILMIVSGDADGLVIGGEMINVRSGPTDLLVTPLEAEAVEVAVATPVVEGFPIGLKLSSSPNPAPGSAQIEFDAPRAGDGVLEILDLRGRRVATLLSGYVEAGPQSVVWNGRDASGVPVAAGIYFARLERGPWRRQTKLVVVR